MGMGPRGDHAKGHTGEVKLSQHGIALVTVIVVAVSLGTLYKMSQAFFTQPMLAALAVNALFAVLALICGASSLCRWPTTRDQWRWTYLPPLAVLGLTITLALATGGFGPRPWEMPYGSHWLSWTLIPIVEEILFRGGFGRVLRARLGPVWGAYWSALLFSLVHDGPQWQDLWQLNLSLPIGPLLLGILCEILVMRSQSLLGPCLLHMACNMSGYLFYQLDPHWLEWLAMLYR